MRNTTFSLLLLLSSSCLTAQIAFTDATTQLANEAFYSGAAIGVVDLNGDGLDDIVRARSNTGVVIDLQNPSGGEFTNQLTVASLSGTVWSLCASDLNNDGINDLCIGTYGQPTVLTSNATDFYSRSLLSQFVFPQGLNTVDMNNDGDLDIFVCHDVGLSTPYAGDGNGGFTYELNLMPAFSDGNSDNSGNYGSLWTDYDNDGDLDMYMSRCRGGVGDPTDPRRMNNLYRNNGDGSYTDVAVAAGLRPFVQSWATDFVDLDNDGDLDVVMVNHQATSRIYEQTSPGIFTDRSAETGIDLVTGWNGIQVFAEDFDNDGDLDILMTAAGGHFIMENNGGFDFSFNHSLDLVATANIQSAACGDLNNDGFLDLLVGHSNGLVGSGSVPDQLLLNSTNDNNWLRVRLNGSMSNPNGIGARLELYGDWGMQIREMRSGESYGIMNSLTDQFGIGSHEEIDQLIVRWPAGSVTTIENPDINQTIVVSESSISFTDIDQTICEGQTFLASNGALYDTEGTYFIDTMINEGGDLVISRLQLNVEPTYLQTEFTTICEGTPFTLPDGRQIIASVTETYQSELQSIFGCDSLVNTLITVLPVDTVPLFASVCRGGDYQLPNGSFMTDVRETFHFTETLTASSGCDSVLFITVNPDPVLSGELELSVCRGTDVVLPDGSQLTNLQESITLELELQTAAGCDSTLATTVTVLPIDTAQLSASICRGGDYQLPDGSIVADVQEPFQFTETITASTGCDSVLVYTLEPDPVPQGSMGVSVCRGSDVELPDGSILLDVQASTSLEFPLEDAAGCDSLLVFNIEVISLELNIINNDSLGFSVPGGADSYQWFDCDNNLPVEGANGPDFLPPYNGSFSLIVEDNGCLETSECFPYVFSSTSEPLWAQNLSIFPNPTDGRLQIALSDYQGSIKVELYAALGQLVLTQVYNLQENLRLDLDEPAGVYWLRLRLDDNSTVTRRILIRK
ncbi:MAG: FG-GAP-like repeat-containing protein [Bacteroidota bacterium]